MDMAVAELETETSMTSFIGANRKTIVHHPADSNSRKTTLPKNKSCPNICAAMDLDTHPRGKILSNKDLTVKSKSDLQSSFWVSEEEEGDYETVSSSTLEAIHALRILPAKPLQESEYADKRCLRPSGTTSPTNSQHTSQLPQYSANPVPPPRPLKTLPKQYQPLPPEPKISSHSFHTRKMLSQAHTFPISAKVTRKGRGFGQATEGQWGEEDKTNGAYKGTYAEKAYCEHNGLCFSRQRCHQLGYTEEPGSKKYQETNVLNLLGHESEITGAALAQDHLKLTALNFEGSMLNMENLSVKRSPSPMPYTACKNKSKHSVVKQEMQSLTQPTEKDLNKYEWYIGEYDRHEAEKALLQENTDETFLVRDCSKKSNAEPYVLVVYYGRRVYNIKVRFLEESQQYALGTGLRGDDKFNSVKEIIDFYKYVPITLIDGKDKSGIQREQCYLTYPFKSHKRRFLP
ncbi:cytokine-dependent hematopoietic cell linker [Morus bassanus]